MRTGLLDQLYRDGYVVLEDLFTASETDEMRKEGEHLAEQAPEDERRIVFNAKDKQQGKEKYFLDSGDKVRFFWESSAFDENDGSLLTDKKYALNKIGHALHVLNPVFRKYTFDERIKEACWQLGLADPAVAQSMYIYKNPGTGSEVTPHQDASYLYTEPVNIIGFWIALEDATVENGCLWMSRGSHKSGVHRRWIRNPEEDAEELLIYTCPPPFYQKSSFTSVPVSKGTCILIHGQVVHYSEPNKSDKSRHAYTFHVIEQRNTVYSKENWLQPTEDQPFLPLYKN